MSNKREFKLAKIEQDAFDEIKRIVARDTLLDYTDLNEEFKIHTDDSKSQLWAVINHKVKPVAFHSKKITDVQKRYTVIESDK